MKKRVKEKELFIYGILSVFVVVAVMYMGSQGADLAGRAFGTMSSLEAYPHALIDDGQFRPTMIVASNAPLSDIEALNAIAESLAYIDPVVTVPDETTEDVFQGTFQPGANYITTVNGQEYELQTDGIESYETVELVVNGEYFGLGVGETKSLDETNKVRITNIGRADATVTIMPLVHQSIDIVNGVMFADDINIYTSPVAEYEIESLGIDADSVNLMINGKNEYLGVGEYILLDDFNKLRINEIQADAFSFTVEPIITTHGVMYTDDFNLFEIDGITYEIETQGLNDGLVDLMVNGKHERVGIGEYVLLDDVNKLRMNDIKDDQVDFEITPVVITVEDFIGDVMFTDDIIIIEFDDVSYEIESQGVDENGLVNLMLNGRYEKLGAGDYILLDEINKFRIKDISDNIFKYEIGPILTTAVDTVENRMYFYDFSIFEIDGFTYEIEIQGIESDEKARFMINGNYVNLGINEYVVIGEQHKLRVNDIYFDSVFFDITPLLISGSSSVVDTMYNNDISVVQLGDATYEIETLGMNEDILEISVNGEFEGVQPWDYLILDEINHLKILKITDQEVTYKLDKYLISSDEGFGTMMYTNDMNIFELSGASYEVETGNINEDGSVDLSINGAIINVNKGDVVDLGPGHRMNIQSVDTNSIVFNLDVTDCVDTDGLDKNTLGTVTDVNGEVLNDACIDTKQLNEAFCNLQGIVEIEEFTCENGCADGACLEVAADYCNDEDHGDSNSAFIKSTIEGSVDGDTFTFTDECKDDNVVLEYVCGNDGQYTTAEMYCGDAGCVDGACVLALDICEEFDDVGNDYDTQGRVTGVYNADEFDKVDYCTGNYLTEYSCSGNTYVETGYTCPIGCLDGRCVDITCDESGDQGFDFMKPGKIETTVNGETFEKWDYCIGDTVRDYSCDGSTESYRDYLCPYGCMTGKCITPSTSCSDEDANLKAEHFIPSSIHMTVLGTSVELTDYCLDDDLFEFSCDGSSNVIERVTCEGACEEGACVQTQCTDSDGGINLYEQAKLAHFNLEGNPYPGETDYCLTTDVLVEYACRDSADIDTYGFEASGDYQGGSLEPMHYEGTFFCEFGCRNGFCNLDTQSDCYETDAGRDYYSYGVTHAVNGEVWFDKCLATGGLIEYYCDPTRIYNGVMSVSQEYVDCACDNFNPKCLDTPLTGGAVFTGNAIVDAVKTDNEVEDPLNKDMIVIGTACENEIVAELLNYPEPCDRGLKDGVGNIQLFNHNGYTQILITGKTAEDRAKAALVLTKFDLYELVGDALDVLGERFNPYVVPSLPEESLVIIDNIGDILFGTGNILYDNCELMEFVQLDTYNCDSHYGEYNAEGLAGVNVVIEERREPFGQEDVKAIAEAIYNNEGFDNIEIGESEGQFVYFLEREESGTSDYYILWGSGDNIIGIGFEDLNQGIIGGEEIELLIGKYLEMYPSDLIESPITEDMCEFGSGIECLDYAYEDEAIHIVVQNDLGYTIKIEELNIEGCVIVYYAYYVGAGDSQSLTVSCNIPLETDRFTGTMELSYINLETQFEHTRTGQISLMVEEEECAPCPVSCNCVCETGEVISCDEPVLLEGDYWQIGTSDNTLELNEGFQDILSPITKSELEALADGSIVTDKGTSDYEQFVTLGNGKVDILLDGQPNSGNVMISKDDRILEYSLEFKTPMKSDIEDSAGDTYRDGVYLGDFEDKQINILGHTYNILQARRTSSSASCKLTLLGGAISDTIEEAETKTYTMDGKDYVIENLIVTDSGDISTKFVVNGEVTDKLMEGEIYTLNDGNVIGVATILPNEAGDVTADLVTFSFGATNIEIEDNDVTDGVSSNTLVVNGHSISEVPVIIEGSLGEYTISIDKIGIDVMARNDYSIPAGRTLSQVMNEIGNNDIVSALLGLDFLYLGLEDGYPQVYIKSGPVQSYGQTLPQAIGQIGRIQEGHTDILSYDGLDYEINSIIVSDTEQSVILSVNGELTRELYEGDIHGLANDVAIVIDEILLNEAGDEGGDLVDFRLVTGSYMNPDLGNIKLIEEGVTDSFDFNGLDYEIFAKLVTDSDAHSVMLVVNGEVTRQLFEGDIHGMPNDVAIVIDEILLNEAGDSPGDIVQFEFITSSYANPAKEHCETGYNFIEEGAVEYLTIDGLDYEIENAIVTDSGTLYTQFIVNGEYSNKIKEGSTGYLADGTAIYVPMIMTNEAGDPGYDLVEYCLIPTDCVSCQEGCLCDCESGETIYCESDVGLQSDEWQIGAPDGLEIDEGFESILTDVELSPLRNGMVKNNFGVSEYEQSLRVDGVVVDNGESVYYGINEPIYSYTLDFKTPIKSRVTDYDGDLSVIGIYLPDFEGLKLNILGDEYTVLQARRTTSGKVESVKLTLLGGLISDHLEEGETKTYNLDGKEYQIENIIVTDSGTIYTQFKVNGEVTAKLREGSTDTLQDGTVIGVGTILPNEYGDVTPDLVFFAFGAEKLEIEDLDVDEFEPSSSKQLRVNDDRIDEVPVIIEGTDDNVTFSIDKIQIDITAGHDYFISAGKTLSEVMIEQGDSDIVPALLGLDMRYDGLDQNRLPEVFVTVNADESQPEECVDSDGGINVFTVGEAFAANQGTTDHCNFLDNQMGTLREAVCEDGVASFVDVECPAGAPYCNSGVCSTERGECTDTDNGDNHYVIGTITEPRYEDGPQHTDYCESLNTLQPVDPCRGDDCGLREYYCSYPYMSTSFRDVACPDGCENGACVGIEDYLILEDIGEYI